MSHFNLQVEGFEIEDSTKNCKDCHTLTLQDFVQGLNQTWMMVEGEDIDRGVCKQIKTLTTVYLAQQNGSVYTKQVESSLSQLNDKQCYFPLNQLWGFNGIEIKSSDDRISILQDVFQDFRIPQVSISIKNITEKLTVYFIVSHIKIFDNGFSHFKLKDKGIIPGNRLVTLIISKVEYMEYSDLLSLFYLSKTPSSKQIFFDTQDILAQSGLNKQNEIILVFHVVSKGLQYTRYPDSLATALAKISGLMLILRISFLLQRYHRRRFFKNQEQNQTSIAKKIEEDPLIPSELNPCLINGKTEESLLQITQKSDITESPEEPSSTDEMERFSFERLEKGVECALALHREFRNFKATTEIASVSQTSQIEKFELQMADELEGCKRGTSKIEQKMRDEIDSLEQQIREQCGREQIILKEIESCKQVIGLQQEQIRIIMEMLTSQKNQPQKQ
ncbi:hypothetical protein FGO68_gene1154 [Halteria grandinella]|uniref:Uncharacterized protein n=1 Tax=Halteria grandinella TaxID=5974 RepID=A0A8J8NUM8_HALGN|nr:hypothetical protein FGO68_gene1154 [Halteria grandinella]